MSDTHRIEGIKFNFDTLSRDEVEGIRGHLLERHSRIIGELALVESYLQPEGDMGQLVLFPVREETPPGVA